VAGGLGLCGLDARRTALHGTEIRPCWAAPDAVAVPDAVAEPVAPVRAATVQRGAGAAVDARPDRTFVPIEDLERSHEPAQALVPGPGRTEVPQQGATPRPDDVADRWTLWGET
jgi:hypothetical protein